MAEKKNYSLEEIRDDLIKWGESAENVWHQEKEIWEYEVSMAYEEGDLSDFAYMAKAGDCIKKGDYVGLTKTYVDYSKSLPKDSSKRGREYTYLMGLACYIPNDDAVKFAMAQPDFLDIELDTSILNDFLVKRNPQYRKGVTRDQYLQSIEDEQEVEFEGLSRE